MKHGGRLGGEAGQREGDFVFLNWTIKESRMTDDGQSLKTKVERIGSMTGV